MPDSRILIAVIGRPHGVRGLVHVTAHAADVTAYGPLADDTGRRFVLRARGEDVFEVTELAGAVEAKLADRTVAEKLTNVRLYVDRAQLPEPEADEFYLADLIGLAAVDPAGRRLGTIALVHDYGAGASLEIERKGAPPLLIPFTHAAVPEVDVAAGRVVVEVPELVDVNTPAPLAGDGWGEGGVTR